MAGILANFYDLADRVHARRKWLIQFYLITALTLQNVSKVKVNGFDFNPADSFQRGWQSDFHNRKVRPRVTQLIELPSFDNLPSELHYQKNHRRISNLFENEFVEIVANAGDTF